MRCIHLLYEQSERETEIDGEAGKEILNLVKESSRDMYNTQNLLWIHN